MQDFVDKDVYTAIDKMFKPLRDKIQGVSDSLSDTIIILEKLQIKLSERK